MIVHPPATVFTVALAAHLKAYQHSCPRCEEIVRDVLNDREWAYQPGHTCGMREQGDEILIGNLPWLMKKVGL